MDTLALQGGCHDFSTSRAGGVWDSSLHSCSMENSVSLPKGVSLQRVSLIAPRSLYGYSRCLRKRVCVLFFNFVSTMPCFLPFSDDVELHVISLTYKDLAGLSKGDKGGESIDKATFLQNFPVPGLVGGRFVRQWTALYGT